MRMYKEYRCLAPLNLDATPQTRLPPSPHISTPTPRPALIPTLHTHAGKAMTLAGLLGMKPAVETVRDLLGAAPFANQLLPNEMMLFITRVIELVFESSPETLVQTVALLATPAAEQSAL